MVPTRLPTVRVYTRAAEDYSLTVRNGDVLLAPANPRDEYQVIIVSFLKSIITSSSLTITFVISDVIFVIYC